MTTWNCKSVGEEMEKSPCAQGAALPAGPRVEDMLRSDIYTRFLHTLKTLRDINFKDKIFARTLNESPFLAAYFMGILVPMAGACRGETPQAIPATIEPLFRLKAYSLWVQRPAVDVSQGLNVV